MQYPLVFISGADLCDIYPHGPSHWVHNLETGCQGNWNYKKYWLLNLQNTIP